MARLVRLLLVLAGVFWLAPGAAPEAAAQAACLPPAQARSAAQAARIIPLVQIRNRIAQAVGGEVVSAQLCQIGERYVYIVNVLTRRGIVRRVVVDAESGAMNGGY